MSEDRPAGAQYRVDGDDGGWWMVGWDRPLGTFYAERFVPGPAGGGRLVDWVGGEVGELATVEALAARVPVALPAQVVEGLAADADAHPFAGAPAYTDVARAVLDAPAPEGTDATSVWVVASCFTTTGILAVDEEGNSTAVGDVWAPAEPGVEYHFRFVEVDEPRRVAVAMTDGSFEADVAGVDAPPALVALCRDAQAEMGSHRVDLVRFVNPATGADRWLGWDVSTASWQEWDDPRRYYPGDPADVLVEHGSVGTEVTVGEPPGDRDATLDALSTAMEL